MISKASQQIYEDHGTGYTMAATTATLRLYKRKHWFSDVIAGAIIGIVSARLSYLLYKKIILINTL